MSGKGLVGVLGLGRLSHVNTSRSYPLRRLVPKRKLIILEATELIGLSTSQR